MKSFRPRFVFLVARRDENDYDERLNGRDESPDLRDKESYANIHLEEHNGSCDGAVPDATFLCHGRRGSFW